MSTGQEAVEDQLEVQDFKEVLAIKSKMTVSTLSYKVRVNGKEIKAIVDTGAQVSLLTEEQAKDLGIEIEPTKGPTAVVGINGKPLTVVGQAMILLEHNAYIKKAIVQVVKDIKQTLILGLPWIREYSPIIHWEDLSMTFLKGEDWIHEEAQGLRLHRKDYNHEKGKDNSIDDQDYFLISVTEQSEDQAEHLNIDDCVPELHPVLQDYEGPISTSYRSTARRTDTTRNQFN